VDTAMTAVPFEAPEDVLDGLLLDTGQLYSR